MPTIEQEQKFITKTYRMEHTLTKFMRSGNKRPIFHHCSGMFFTEESMNRIYFYLIVSLLQFCFAFSIFAQEDESIPMFIQNFEFKGFEGWPIETYGEILAAEAQNGLHHFPIFQVSTYTNLKDQLKKEQQKELLSCDEANCTQQIIENFGFSDSVFGRITNLTKQPNPDWDEQKKTDFLANQKKSYQIYLTYAHGDTIAHSKTKIVSKEFDVEECADTIRELIVAMFKEKGYSTEKEKPKYASLAVTSDPVGAEVVLNNVSAGVTPLKLDKKEPGKYSIQLKKEGYELSQTQMIELTSGQEKKFHQTLIVLAPKPPVAPEVKIKIETGGNGWMYTMFVLALASGGGSAYFGLQSMDNANELKKVPILDLDRRKTLTDQGNLNALLSNSLLGVAIVSGGIGGYLLFSDSDNASLKLLPSSLVYTW